MCQGSRCLENVVDLVSNPLAEAYEARFERLNGGYIARMSDTGLLHGSVRH